MGTDSKHTTAALERLAEVLGLTPDDPDPIAVLGTAKARVERLHAENERLRAALRPFAEAADGCDADRERLGVDPKPDHACTTMTYRSLAAARDALD